MYAHANQLYRQVKKHGSIDTVIFCDDQGNWSQAVKIAASRELAVKINAWLAAIFMTFGLPTQ